MTRRSSHSLESSIETVLEPGWFIDDRATWSFVDDLYEVDHQIAGLASTDPARAAGLYELFLAGAYEKAEEVDDSSGRFGMFVADLFCEWVRARQRDRADPDDTARLLLARMDDDPYGFTYQIERDVATAFNKRGLAAFERQVRGRFDQAVDESDDERDYARRRWSEALRAIYAAQRNVDSYAALCERTEMTAADCETLATNAASQA